MTIPNKKISASIVMVVPPSKTSGAANPTAGTSAEDKVDSRSDVAIHRSRPAIHA